MGKALTNTSYRKGNNYDGALASRRNRVLLVTPSATRLEHFVITPSNQSGLCMMDEGLAAKERYGNILSRTLPGSVNCSVLLDDDGRISRAKIYNYLLQDSMRDDVRQVAEKSKKLFECTISHAKEVGVEDISKSLSQVEFVKNSLKNMAHTMASMNNEQVRTYATTISALESLSRLDEELLEKFLGSLSQTTKAL